MIGMFARHRTAANLLMILLMAMGAYGAFDLRRETMPDFTSGELQITVPYPGASAEEVEEAICQRIEDVVDGISYVHEVRSEAREGVGTVVVEIEEGADFDVFRNDIETEVDTIRDFPEDSEDPVIEQLGRMDLVLAILVSGTMTAPDMNVFCDQFKDRIQALPEVSLVELAGFSDRQLRIELSPAALLRHSLSASDVATIIKSQSVDLPAGSIETQDRDLLVRFVERRRSPNEYADLVILEEADGARVLLRDIGRVTDQFETEESKVMLDGQRVGLLHVKKAKNEDLVFVAETVKAFLAEEEERQPEGITFTVTQDTSTLVRDRLQMLFKNGWQGVILVFLTMWLFFSLRFSFWVAMGLPVAFFGALFFMPLIGLTINMLTMVGLLLALGLLMDDAIVIAENIATHLAKGKSAMQAAIDGTSEVKSGVISSFLTTVCIFGPLVAIEGDIGKVLRVVPMTLILVLMVSLIEAFLILPSHLGHSLGKSDATEVNRFRQRFDSIIEWMRERVVGRTVDTLLRWRYLTVGVVVMALLASMAMLAGGVLKFQAFPNLDGDVIVARVLLPQGTPLHRTEAVIAQMRVSLSQVDDKFSAGQPSGKRLVQTVSVNFNENADAFEQGPHVATIFVELLSAEIRRNARVDDILNAWRGAVGQPADVISLVYAEPFFGPAGRAIEIRVQPAELTRSLDPDEVLTQSLAAAEDLRSHLSNFTGVYNLSTDLRRGKQEFQVSLKEGALGLGLDAAKIARQLRDAFHGSTIDEIQVGSDAFDIDVRLNPVGQDSLADLTDFYVTTPAGEQMRLSAVANITPDRGWARIARVNGRRTVTLRGDVDSKVANTAALIGTLHKDFIPGWQERHPGSRIDYQGEVDESKTTQGSMLRGMLIGILGVFILLSFQFRTYLEPLVVMTAIPCAFIGVIWGHLLLGVEFCMPSMLGFISLAGVVVNDSILLVLFIKQHVHAGESVLSAAAQASRRRFRAILLTSLTTMAGLLPLLLERSLQAQILNPLAISIVFGIFASTILVLLITPCLYAILGDMGFTERIHESSPKAAPTDSEESMRGA